MKLTLHSHECTHAGHKFKSDDGDAATPATGNAEVPPTDESATPATDSSSGDAAAASSAAAGSEGDAQTINKVTMFSKTY